MHLQHLAKLKKYRYHDGRVFYNVDRQYMSREFAEIKLTDLGIHLQEIEDVPIENVERLPPDPRLAGLNYLEVTKRLSFYGLDSTEIPYILMDNDWWAKPPLKESNDKS